MSSKVWHLTLVLASSLALSACVTTGKSGTDASASQCTKPELSAEQRQLCTDNEVFNQTVLGGVAENALIGAGLGCAAGFFLGGGAGDCVKGAAAGAVLGGVLGGLDGYRKAKQEEATKNNIREIDAIAADVHQDNIKLASSVSNARAVVKSHQKRLKMIAQARVSDQESLAKAQADRASAQSDKERIDSIIAGLQKRQKEYNSAQEKSGQTSTQYTAEIEHLNKQIAELTQTRDTLVVAIAKASSVS